MTAADDIALIDKLRRAMPRNDLVAAVCRIAERNVTAAATAARNVTKASPSRESNVTECPVCKQRREENADRVRRHRERKRAR
jgi:hypothetical protein